MRALLLALLLTSAQGAPGPVEVRLSNFDFAPETIRLRAGAPVVLRLVNTSSGGHNFAAPDFFAAAQGVSGPVENGAVEVPERAAVEIRLTPARGSYRLRCTHTLHSTFGMRGTIVVE
jgi:plastocyanin